MSLVQYFFFQLPSYDKVIMGIASELNKTCPFMVDRETRLDNTVAFPSNVFQYNYTLINMEKGSVNIERMKKHMEPRIINYVKTDPAMKFPREHETTVIYHYNDKHGVHLFSIPVTPDKYEN